jgi:hypothetical protein
MIEETEKFSDQRKKNWSDGIELDFPRIFRASGFLMLRSLVGVQCAEYQNSNYLLQHLDITYFPYLT